jgi:hypothetical protein
MHQICHYKLSVNDLWLVDEAAFEVVAAIVSPNDVVCAASSLLKFIFNWLHEPVFDVQEYTVVLFLFEYCSHLLSMWM